jgi:7-cyano-7-deazaguanine synthase
MERALGTERAAGRDAVILLSGGLDSYTAAAIARQSGLRLFGLTVRYGQRHARELEAARAVADALQVVRHLEVAVDLASLGGSSLTGAGPIPRERAPDDRTIPDTYVPARNTVLLAMALGWAEALGATDLVIGANAVDYSGYPDCRPEFLQAFERLAALATKAGVEGASWKVHAPLIAMSKAQIIRRGIELGLDYGLTHSCYDPLPDGAPCARCDSCRLRAKGFLEAGVLDPLVDRRVSARSASPHD